MMSIPVGRSWRISDRAEVLGLMAQSLSNQQISEKLVLSEATVKTHVARVIMKIGCRDRAQAVALAYQSGLIRIR